MIASIQLRGNMILYTGIASPQISPHIRTLPKVAPSTTGGPVEHIVELNRRRTTDRVRI